MAQLSAGSLRSYFKLIAPKRVQDSEVNPDSSNSHEFNGTGQLKDFLGLPPFDKCKRLDSRLLYFSDERSEPLVADAQLTWYKTHSAPKRKEWRLYYPENPVVGDVGAAQPGDLIVFIFSKDAERAPEIAKDSIVPSGTPVMWTLIAPRGSISEREISRLFGLQGDAGDQLELLEPPTQEVDAIGRQLLDGLGIRLNLPDNEWREKLTSKFGDTMPEVARFSDYAVSTLKLDFVGDPDGALVSWWEREDLLFRIHDRNLIRKPVEEAFRRAKGGGDIDIEELRALFMSSTQTARSRAGRAFEHQLAAIFRKNSLRFETQRRTAKKDIPDFLFPSLELYERSPHIAHLTMLAAKTTCKERWTQVLHEAPRIRQKHLATISPAIPADQLARIRDAHVTLVLPASRHGELSSKEAPVMTLREFIALVQERQSKFG